MQKVILVDINDHQTGVEDKLAAHEKGLLHRAFSVMISDKNGNILLQQRAQNKYHSAGLWTNACCSHPGPDENLEEAAMQRLKMEMGIETRVKKEFDFIYKIKFEDGITEYEFDHVFSGVWNGTPIPNPDEVSAWKWISKNELLEDIKRDPGNYTYWFRLIMQKF